MNDRILEQFFSIDRWTKAIDKGVGKDIRRDQLIKLCSERTRLTMYQAIKEGRYMIAPPHTAQIPKENGEFRTVSCASLYSESCAEKLGIQPGSTIEVGLSNDVIPKVYRVVG